jgi:hypothetical protein
VALECLENSGRKLEKTTNVSQINTFEELLGHWLRQINNSNISFETTEKPLAMF